MDNCTGDCVNIKTLKEKVDKLEIENDKLEFKVDTIAEKQNKWITKTAVQDNPILTFNKNFEELKADLKKIGSRTVGSILFLVLVQVMALIFVKVK